MLESTKSRSRRLLETLDAKGQGIYRNEAKSNRNLEKETWTEKKWDKQSTCNPMHAQQHIIFRDPLTIEINGVA